jgi:catechol 2,3-dioxygenase
VNALEKLMNRFRMPDEVHIRHVHLQVSDLDAALAFYGHLLGFQHVGRNGATATLSATGQAPYHILLTERPGARPKPARTTGLYHVAIRFPRRHALARAFRRLVEHRWPFQGFSDHRVSETLYLADPGGNGLELHVDRPQDRWSWQHGQVTMATDPLDAEVLLSKAARDPEAWNGVHPETDIGHVHLHVSDLGRAETSYHGILGLDVTQRSYPGALFLSAGGYHHHLGVNVWAGVGASPPPPKALGLLSFAFHLPDLQSRDKVLARAQAASLDVESGPEYEHAESALIRDPDGNGVELLVENKSDL